MMEKLSAPGAMLGNRALARLPAYSSRGCKGTVRYSPQLGALLRYRRGKPPAGGSCAAAVTYIRVAFPPRKSTARARAQQR